MHKLTIQLSDKQGKSDLAKIAASLGFIKARGVGAGKAGSISAMVQALVRGELEVVGPSASAPLPYHERYPEGINARRAIAGLVRRGIISPASTLICSECSDRAKHYHHPDYLRPLYVIPLCVQCHGAKHRTK